jgi:hypothetical protein
MSPAGMSVACRRCAMSHRPFLKRALIVSVVIGTCLTLINQGDALIGSSGAPTLFWKIPLTYSVPFMVSYYSSVAAARAPASSKDT